MGLLENIRRDAEKSGQNKAKFIYVKDGQKIRIRFLQDMQEGWEIPFHDSFEAGINIPCREFFGKTCPYCGEEGLRTRNQYAWSVWDYESKEVKIFMFPMNNCTPIASIASMYENYGTLTDRDYVIQRTGKQQNTSYSVIPMDKNKFRNDKAKPFSKSAFIKILNEAFPVEHKDKFDTADTEEPEEKETESAYAGKTAKELYKLCKERGIEAVVKKPEKYYINLLEEDDKSHEDWDEEEDDLPWDDAEEESGDEWEEEE